HFADQRLELRRILGGHLQSKIALPGRSSNRNGFVQWLHVDVGLGWVSVRLARLNPNHAPIPGSGGCALRELPREPSFNSFEVGFGNRLSEFENGFVR